MSDYGVLTTSWRKSRYSGGHGGNCLEVRWHKSTYSGGNEGDCVECRTDQGHVLIRDSQHSTHGHLAFPSTEWAAFVQTVRTGAL
ncbi:DUF397 domain-containing protein [Lipingzhangella sp. LS1_29]|uniref:DUF397 domain-containing protein n=1 Tax=Lipingzhangella rawalii TaxID=2055835 RepID=A0ABU2H1V1_9ACTN|nr:DUF397 domain-containing protein [Lipingzhangella rawalii]MDS1269278.1 DUF397 domain-containing protein [Lipingzhangella rawalii]